MTAPSISPIVSGRSADWRRSRRRWVPETAAGCRRWFISTEQVHQEDSPAPQAAARRQQPAATSQFCIELARQLADTRCRDIVILDVKGISPITDYMVLATGVSSRQMKTTLDEAQELAQSHGLRALGRSDDAGSNWLVIDLVDVVFHVFSADARSYYDLDSLWGDARQIDWQRPGSSPRPGA